MLIRRQLYTHNKLPMKKAHDSGMELKPIYKKVPPSTPVNKVLQTSSAGSSIVRDVDDLLKPIQHQNHHDESNSSQTSKERTERNLWRNDEVMEMLYTMQELKALEKLNDKTVKSENVFKDVEVIMHRNGFVKKSHVQIWTKWKFLKSTYMTSRRNGVIPRMVPPQVYDTIHKMITGLNQSITDSCSSVDGDNSSVSGMVISGVEGGVSNVGVTNGEDEDSFGMAHPIFGFRLGMVKSEPEDTGYEAVENNGSDKDPLEEEQCHSKSDNQVKEENNHLEAKTIKEPEPIQKPIEIPHRGRGRPPKNPPTATSTPNNTPSPATKSAQMPPLRVAPFAKAINSSNAIAVNRPPPPLTMPPTPRIRVTNLNSLKNEDPSRFAQPKLIPKPTHQQQSPPVHQGRLPKEVTTQSRASSTPSPSYPKMKQIPMRKTPYSLRPDRAIPDLDASLSPPPPPIEKSTNKRIEEVANTRQLIMQSNTTNNLPNNTNRKRRLEMQQDPLIGKQAKYSDSMQEEEMNTARSHNSNNNDDSKNYGRVMQNVIIDLSSSLRKMQTEMMQDFFKKQNELLEREHRFQMQQDQMLMKAFQEQTQEIMLSVKQLVGNIKTHKNGRNDDGGIVKEAKLNRNRRMQQRQRRQEPEEEIEEDHIQRNDIEGDADDEHDNGMEDGEQDQAMEDVYSDGEEQQDQMDEHNENDDQDDMDNNPNEEEEEDVVEDNEQQEDEEQSQSTDDHQENILTAEENDNSNDSTEDDQNPLN